MKTERPDLQVADTGTELTLTLQDEANEPVDLTAATALALIIERPDGTTLEKTAAPVGDPALGILAATTSANDLNQAGTYKIQAAISLPAWTGRSQVKAFRVNRNL